MRVFMMQIKFPAVADEYGNEPVMWGPREILQALKECNHADYQVTELVPATSNPPEGGENEAG